MNDSIDVELVLENACEFPYDRFIVFFLHDSSFLVAATGEAFV